MMTYSHKQLEAMDAASISQCSPKHIESVIAKLIETARATKQVQVPVAWAAYKPICDRGGNQIGSDLKVRQGKDKPDNVLNWRPLVYGDAQPAKVGEQGEQRTVKVPDEMAVEETPQQYDNAEAWTYASGFNACRAEVLRMNGGEK